MPILVPVDHDPFAADLNALGNVAGQNAPTQGSLLPNANSGIAVARYAQSIGRDPLGDATGGFFGDDDAPKAATLPPRNDRQAAAEWSGGGGAFRSLTPTEAATLRKQLLGQ